MFVRTLPLLIDCSNQDVSSFLDYSSGLINSVMKYDLYPFRILANQYDLTSDILFQYSHSLFYDLMDNDELPYKVEELKHDSMGDLSFFIFDLGEDSFGIKILYSDKFSKGFIEDFAKTYELILKEMMDADKLSDINYIKDEDIKLLESYYRKEDLDYDDVLDAFNDNLSNHPDNPLVSYGDVSYSYAEGAFIADRIAKSLKDIGVKAQDNVAFLLERSELYMFSALAIMSIGAVYVPIDDALPDERIRFMIEDADAKAVIVSDATFQRAQGLVNKQENGNILLNISSIVKDDCGALTDLPVIYGDLACILYTSGTTGIPKGVRITRKGITSYVDFYVKEYEMRNDSTFGLFSSIGFDVGAIRGLCAPLYGGSSLDIVPMDIRLDIKRLNEHFIAHNVSHTTLPTQVARMFINEVEDTSLKVLITGGEKLGEVNADLDYSFIDSYGPTECCVAVCAIEECKKIDSSSIGHLFRNIKAYVLDKESRQVPIGAVGELCISGNQLADGYLNREKETEEAFVENPFDKDEDYSMMYHTGDMVRVLPDGSLGIVGRRDGQVKVRGNRVELAEVEAIISGMDHIINVSVQTIDFGGNRELVAYVVADDEIAEGNIQELVCSHVSFHQPDYMVPTFVMALDEIPLTLNGKVDKKALPEVDRSLLHNDYVAPKNENEQAIVNAFEKVFGLEKVSGYDDFIRLGGDSLTAIKLLSHLENYHVTAADILSLRTPEAISNNMDDVSFDLDVYSLETGCPLNEAQVNLFADIMFSNTVDIFHIPIYMQIPKRYGIEKILDALDEILKVHPILTMHLSDHYEKGEKKNLFARITEDMDLLKDLGDNFGDQSLVDLLKEKNWNVKSIYDMISTVLKLFKGQYPYLVKGSKPPMSVESNFNMDMVKDFMTEAFDYYNYLSMFKIFELEDSYLFLAKCHHIIFDGLSGNVFKRNFQILLDGGSIDVDDSFLKMSAFHQQIKGTDKFIEASDFFDSMLGGIGELERLSEDGKAGGYSLSVYDLELDHRAVESFLESGGISENILFTSAFAYALAQLTGGEDVLFTMIDNGRGRFNDYDSVGLYANIAPLLINCRNRSISSFMEHLSDRVYGAIKYDFYPVLLLFQKYPLDAEVIFQFVPNWVNYDGVNEDSSEIFSFDSSDDFLGDFLSNLNDLIAEFIVQVFQNGDKYSVMIVNSNKYSEKMVKDFKDVYELILSNIICSDLSDDLNNLT